MVTERSASVGYKALCAIVLGALGGAGCSAHADDDVVGATQEPVYPGSPPPIDTTGSASSPLTSADPTPRAPWVVGILTSKPDSPQGTVCTAIVLSSSYLLTTNRCISKQTQIARLQVTAMNQNNPQIIYDGPAFAKADPDYTDFELNWQGRIAHDVALVRTSGRALTLTSQAKLLAAPLPWAGGNPAHSIISWGKTNVTGSWICANTPFIKRIASGYTVEQNTATTGWLLSPLLANLPCGGDNGGPFVTTSGGEDIAFALFIARFEFLNGPKMAGAVIRVDKLTEWSETLAYTPGLPVRRLSCTDNGQAGGTQYVECADLAPGTPPASCQTPEDCPTNGNFCINQLCRARPLNCRLNSHCGPNAFCIDETCYLY